MKHRQFLVVLAVLFAALWAALAVAPFDRADWALENALVALVVVLLASTHRRFTL